MAPRIGCMRPASARGNRRLSTRRNARDFASSDGFVRGGACNPVASSPIERVKSAPLAEGFTEVLVPGEPEDRYEAQRRKSGIPYASSEVKALQDEAGRAGIQPLVASERPIAS